MQHNEEEKRVVYHIAIHGLEKTRLLDDSYAALIEGNDEKNKALALEWLTKMGKDTYCAELVFTSQANLINRENMEMHLNDTNNTGVYVALSLNPSSVSEYDFIDRKALCQLKQSDIVFVTPNSGAGRSFTDLLNSNDLKSFRNSLDSILMSYLDEMLPIPKPPKEIIDIQYKIKTIKEECLKIYIHDYDDDVRDIKPTITSVQVRMDNASKHFAELVAVMKKFMTKVESETHVFISVDEREQCLKFIANLENIEKFMRHQYERLPEVVLAKKQEKTEEKQLYHIAIGGREKAHLLDNSYAALVEDNSEWNKALALEWLTEMSGYKYGLHVYPSQADLLFEEGIEGSVDPSIGNGAYAAVFLNPSDVTLLQGKAYGLIEGQVLRQLKQIDIVSVTPKSMVGSFLLKVLNSKDLASFCVSLGNYYNDTLSIAKPSKEIIDIQDKMKKFQEEYKEIAFQDYENYSQKEYKPAMTLVQARMDYLSKYFAELAI